MSGHVIDLGDDHTIEFTSYKGDDRAGAIVTHKTPAGNLCESSISFRWHSWVAEFKSGIPDQSWELVSDNPVTLSPSLACRACGDHGFITGGKWVKA
jgi:hypothetical protein